MPPDSRSWLTGRRARGYLRVSSAPQADKYGPAAQRYDEEQAAKRLGLNGLSDFYEDHVTGRNALVRSDFQRMVADARTHQFDVLIVGRVDRFARNERDAWNYLHALEQTGVAVYFCEEDVLVPHDDGWQDRIGTEINSAAAYSRKLSRNVRKGLARKWAAGGHVGGVPWGYRRTDDKRMIAPDPQAAPQRALLFELYATGRYTFQTLAQELNGRGIRIRSKGRERAFTKFTVSDVLSNPVVIGTVTWRAKKLDGERRDGVAPIVSPDTWERVQEIASGRRTSRQKVAQRRHAYLFASVARCAGCGETYWGRMSHRRDWHYAQIRHAPRGCTEGARTRNEGRLSDQFGRWLASWSLPADARTRIARYIGSAQGDTASEVRRQQFTGELDRLLNLYRWGDMAEAEYLRERDRVTRSLEALGRARAVPDVNADALHLAASIGTAWQHAAPEKRKAFLDEWFAELRLHGDGRIDVLPREAVREVVYIAAPSYEVGMVGSTGLEPVTSAMSTLRSNQLS